MSSNPSGGCSERVRRPIAAILGALLASGAPAAVARAELPLCAPWAGELDPLPSVSDPDPLRAAWAEIRANQLVEAAWKLEPHSRVLANRVWRHASCLDPDRLEFVHALSRTAPVRWARPPILAANGGQAGDGEERPDPVSEWSWDPGEPIRVALTRTPTSIPSRDDRLERFEPSVVEEEDPIAAAEKALREARFELALEWVERGRSQLEAQRPTREGAGRRAQLEVLAATAEIALGQEAAARGSLERALRAEPELRLDPTRHSPKLVRLFDQVRAGGGPSP
jgi:hypothetical protein